MYIVCVLCVLDKSSVVFCRCFCKVCIVRLYVHPCVGVCVYVSISVCVRVCVCVLELYTPL